MYATFDNPDAGSIERTDGAPARQGLSVSVRLGILVASCVGLLCLITGFAWHQLDRNSSLATALGTNALPSVQQTLELRLQVSEYRAAELRVLSEPNNRPAVLADLERAGKSVEAALPGLRAMLTTSDEQSALDRFFRTWQSYRAASLKAIDLAQNKQWDDAWILLTGESQQEQEAMHKSLEQLSQLKTEAAASSVRSIEEGKQTALLVMASCSLAGVLFAIALATLLARSIVGPLLHALEVATSVADGDLSHPVVATGPREIANLLSRLQQMQESLRGLVNSVRSSSDALNATSNECASGNRDLSSRTDLQTRHLSEMMMTLGQLSGAVTHNTAASGEANQMVSEASAVATRGGVAVARVVATMNEINEASRRIAGIVDLTKDIAFQTDILAINAAVEAARASGQGRAFAVVATEVRTLAKKSSAAAREIASLIAASVEKVNIGAKEVNDAGRTMDEIVFQVSRVSECIGGIAVATEQQTKGIDSVNKALGALNKSAQENVSLVERNRGTSDALQGQSAQLVGMVSLFKTATLAPY